MRMEMTDQNTEILPRRTVACAEDCGAFVDPETLDEYKAALEHWIHHSESEYGGCSHGM
jgi:hypothetical protein